MNFMNFMNFLQGDTPEKSKKHSKTPLWGSNQVHEVHKFKAFRVLCICFVDIPLHTNKYKQFHSIFLNL